MPTPEQSASLDRADPVALGARIRDVRRANGLGQAEVAQAVGISISYISRIEAGKRRCDLGLLARIADVLRADLDALLGENLNAQDRPGDARVELEFARVALEMGEAQTALEQAGQTGLHPSDPFYRPASILRARALEALGRIEDAISELEPIPRQGDGAPTGDDLAIAVVLSRCYREAGAYVRAIRVGEQALEALTGSNLTGSDEAIQLTVTVAAAYFEKGDREYALRLCNRALAAAEDLASPQARASAYWNYAIMDLERGNAVSAIFMAKRAYALLSEGQDARNLGRLEAELGLMELRVSPPNIEDAARHLDRAYDIFLESAASAADLHRLEASRARWALLAGDPGLARERALKVASECTDRLPQVASEAGVVAGEASMALGDIEGARRHFLAAVAALVGVGDDRGVGQLWLNIGSHLQAVGELSAAADAFQRAAVAAGLTVPPSNALSADRSDGY